MFVTLMIAEIYLGKRVLWWTLRWFYRRWYCNTVTQVAGGAQGVFNTTRHESRALAICIVRCICMCTCTVIFHHYSIERKDYVAFLRCL